MRTVGNKVWLAVLLCLALPAIMGGCPGGSTPPPPEGMIFLSPPSATVNPGSAANFSLGRSTSNVGGNVTVTGLPTGAVATSQGWHDSMNQFVPLTITVGTSVAPGTYPFEVKVDSGQKVNGTLVVTNTQEIYLTDPTTPLVAGGTGSTTLERTNSTINGNIVLSNLPAGVTDTITPSLFSSTTTTGASILFRASTNVINGNYTFTVTVNGLTTQGTLNITGGTSGGGVVITQWGPKSFTATACTTTHLEFLGTLPNGQNSLVTLTDASGKTVDCTMNFGDTGSIDVSPPCPLTQGTYSVKVDGTVAGALAVN